MELALVTIFSTSFVLALSGALMPGPLLTVTVSESSRRGTGAGPLMICGHGLLELAMVAALLAGLAPILVKDEVFVFISLTGGAILLYMGITMLKGLPGMVLHEASSPAPAEAGRNLVLAGLILSAVNPYWLIWWASIGLGYIVYAMKFGLLGVAAFFLGHILADLAWYTLVSFGIARGSHLLGNDLYRKLIGGCAVFLIAFAGWFFYSGAAKALSLI